MFAVVRSVSVCLAGEIGFFFVGEGTAGACFAEEQVGEEIAEGAAEVGVHDGLK